MRSKRSATADIAWLKSYESRRVDGFERQKITSSRFDLEGLSPNEIREIPLGITIPETGEELTFGPGIQALKRSWFHLKRNKSEGIFHNQEIQFRINRFQHFLGFPLTEWRDLDPEWVKQELEMEEPSGESGVIRSSD